MLVLCYQFSKVRDLVVYLGYKATLTDFFFLEKSAYLSRVKSLISTHFVAEFELGDLVGGWGERNSGKSAHLLTSHSTKKKMYWAATFQIFLLLPSLRTHSSNLLLCIFNTRSGHSLCATSLTPKTKF